MNNRPGYKHTPLGWIPEEWHIKDLIDVASIKRGRFSPRPRNDPKYYGGNIPFVQTGDVTNSNGEVTTHSQTLNEEGLKVSVVFPAGTILMTIASNIGHTAILKYDMACPDSLVGIISKENIDKQYLNYFFSFNQRRIEYIAPGAQKNINIEFLEPLPIVYPKLCEQRGIAAIIATWEEAISNVQQLIAHLQQRNKGLRQKLLRGKKRLKGFNKPWNEIHVGDAFNERNETGYINLNLLSVGSLGVYPQSQSEKRDTSNSDKAKYKRICPGDIGYNTMRMWQGRSALSSLEGIVSPAYTIVTPKQGHHSEFYAYLFKLPSVVNKFFRNSQGLVEDTLNCKFKDFSKVKVEVPEYEEQVAIANVLTTAQAEIKSCERKLNALQQQKKGLMQKLLTGEVRVKI